MKTERFRWLAAIIHANPQHKLIGRTRLQKQMYLLQQLGLPADYQFRMHHYGTYSEGIQSDIMLLERLGLVEEEQQPTRDDERTYSVFTARDSAAMDEVGEFSEQIQRMSEEDSVVLELAATYDAFFQKTGNHERAQTLLERMKQDKCEDNRMEKARTLLADLKLQSAAS